MTNKKDYINKIEHLHVTRTVDEYLTSTYTRIDASKLYDILDRCGFIPCNLEFRKPKPWDIYLSNFSYLFQVCDKDDNFNSARLVISPLKDKEWAKNLF